MRDVPHEELQGAAENVLTLASLQMWLNEATRGAGQLMTKFGFNLHRKPLTYCCWWLKKV